jgi:hypothetical protein
MFTNQTINYDQYLLLLDLQDLLGSEALEAVRNLLPHNVNGDLSALCTWPDQIRHWYKYRWTSPLHFIDTPDNDCTFGYESKPNAHQNNFDLLFFFFSSRTCTRPSANPVYQLSEDSNNKRVDQLN